MNVVRDIQYPFYIFLVRSLASLPHIPFYHTQLFNVIPWKSSFHHPLLHKNIPGFLVPIIPSGFQGFSEPGPTWRQWAVVERGCAWKLKRPKIEFQLYHLCDLELATFYFLESVSSSVKWRYNLYLIGLLGGIKVASFFKELNSISDTQVISEFSPLKIFPINPIIL